MGITFCIVWICVLAGFGTRRIGVVPRYVFIVLRRSINK